MPYILTGKRVVEKGRSRLTNQQNSQKSFERMKEKALFVVDEMTKAGWPKPKLEVINPEDYIENGLIDHKKALSDLEQKGFNIKEGVEIFDLEEPTGSGYMNLGGNQHVLVLHPNSSSYLLGEHSDYPFTHIKETEIAHEHAENFTVYHEVAHMYSSESWMHVARDVGVKLPTGDVSEYIGQLSNADNEAKILRSMDESVSDSFATYMCLRDDPQSVEACEKILATRCLAAQSGFSVKYQTASAIENSLDIAKGLGVQLHDLDANRVFDLAIKSGLELDSYSHDVNQDSSKKEAFSQDFHVKTKEAASLQAATVYRLGDRSSLSGIKGFFLSKMGSEISQQKFAEEELLLGKGYNPFIKDEDKAELYQQGKNALDVVYKNQLKHTPEYHKAYSASLREKAELSHEEDASPEIESPAINKSYEINR